MMGSGKRIRKMGRGFKLIPMDLLLKEILKRMKCMGRGFILRKMDL